MGIDWVEKSNMEKLKANNGRECDSLRNQEVIRDLKNSILYVHRGRIKCIRDKHNVECVNAHFMTVSEENVTFNVNYCKECDLYFISEEEYLYYLKKYRTIIARVEVYSENVDSGIEGLASSSPLLLCGYSVSAESALSGVERKQLLMKVILNKIMKKDEVIRMLEWFIHVNGRKTSNADAKKKWEHDLEFVRMFNMENQENYKITKILPYKDYRKKSQKD